MRAQLELSAGCLVLIEHRLDGRLCVRLDAGYRMVADRGSVFRMSGHLHTWKYEAMAKQLLHKARWITNKVISCLHLSKEARAQMRRSENRFCLAMSCTKSQFQRRTMIDVGLLVKYILSRKMVYM